MKLRIENVGIISSSTINLNGLTVITGPNNSGKTTVGKTLFSLITAMENLTALAFEDKKNFALMRIHSEYEELGISLYSYFSYNKEKNTTKNPFQNILNEIKTTKSIEEIIEIISNLIEIFINLDIYTLKNYLPKISQISYNRTLDRILENKDTSILRLKKLIKTLESDMELTSYSNTKILKYLNNEFNNQIVPVKKSHLKPSIRLYDDNISYFNIQSLEDEGVKYCKANPFEKCFLIDDINVLNDLVSVKYNIEFKSRRRVLSRMHSDDILFSDLILTHNTHLAAALLKNISIYEESIYKNETKEILEEISKEFSSTILYKNRNFICDNDGLNIKNLASGTKLFAIIKTLIQKGAINEKTILVLDEPENHLHPEWQNKLAEIIVLLVKFMGTKIVITTHSPTFLLALETMTKQNQMEKIFSAYLSEKCEDNYMVFFKEITSNLNKAYEHLNLPYISMNTLYEELSNNCED